MYILNFFIFFSGSMLVCVTKFRQFYVPFQTLNVTFCHRRGLTTMLYKNQPCNTNNNNNTIFQDTFTTTQLLLLLCMCFYSIYYYYVILYNVNYICVVRYKNPNASQLVQCKILHTLLYYAYDPHRLGW